MDAIILQLHTLLFRATLLVCLLFFKQTKLFSLHDHHYAYTAYTALLLFRGCGGNVFLYASKLVKTGITVVSLSCSQRALTLKFAMERKENNRDEFERENL